MGKTEYMICSPDLGVSDIDEIILVYLKQKNPKVFSGIS